MNTEMKPESSGFACNICNVIICFFQGYRPWYGMGSSDPDNHRRNIIFATALICAFYQMLHAFLGIIGLHNFPQFLIIQVLCEAIGAKQEEIADLHLFGKDVHLNVSLLTQAACDHAIISEPVSICLDRLA